MSAAESTMLHLAHSSAHLRHLRDKHAQSEQDAEPYPQTTRDGDLGRDHAIATRLRRRTCSGAPDDAAEDGAAGCGSPGTRKQMMLPPLSTRCASIGIESLGRHDQPVGHFLH